MDLRNNRIATVDSIFANTARSCNFAQKEKLNQRENEAQERSVGMTMKQKAPTRDFVASDAALNYAADFSVLAMECAPEYRAPAAGAGWAAYGVLKRFVDVVLSALAIIFLALPMLAIAAVIRLTSPGAAVFRQQRVGRNGKLFITYKFRTMVDGADQLEKHLTPEQLAIYQRERKLPNDPRVTRVGNFLRKTSLDELPQIFNIFRGDMSIVGPRPMMPEEIRMYGTGFWRYIKVRPGLTGLWQINSRCRTSMRNRARLDECYLNNMCARLDIWIFFHTLQVVFTKKGAC